MASFGYYERVMRHIPPERCACTGWYGKPLRRTSGYTLVNTFYAGCRGPGATEYELHVNVPGMQYPPPLVTLPEGSKPRKVMRHAAEAVIYTFAGKHDPRPAKRHLGYFKSLAVAKHAARAAVERRCRKGMGHG